MKRTAHPARSKRSRRPKRSPLAERRKPAPTVRQLKRELDTTRRYLESVIQKHEVGNEELRSANEEILLSMEELQRTNEVLATTKEELQATNEELTILNEELENRNEEAVQANSDLLNLLSSANIPIVILGRDLTIRRFTASAQRILNINPTDVGRPLRERKAVIDFDGLEAELESVLKTMTAKEREFRDRDGHWYSLALRPYRTLDNRIEGVVLTLNDIDSIKRSEADHSLVAIEESSARRKAEDALREERNRIRATLDSVEDAILTIDENGLIQSANASVERLFGYSPAELLACNVTLILPSPHDGNHAGHLASYRAAGTKKMTGIGREVTGLRKDGSQFPVDLRVVEMQRAGQRLFLGVVRDLSKLKEAEAEQARIEQLAAARERLAIIGELAADVAHEFRNPLHGVLNCLQIMREQTQDPEMLKWLSLGEEGLRRMESVSGRMLRLAREDSDHRTPTKVADIVDSALALVKPVLFKTKIKLACEIEPDLPLISVDSERVTEALVNLLTNAIDACQSKCKITVNASQWRDDCVQIIRLAVSDNGSGISPDVSKRVFEPFFTTKAIGKGSGLGLAIVKRITENHGGWVELKPLPKGTSVTMCFPLEIKAVAANPE